MSIARFAAALAGSAAVWVIGGSASASTVTVDFTTGQNEPGCVVGVTTSTNPEADTTCRWIENGFAVKWDAELVEIGAPVTPDDRAFQFLVDTIPGSSQVGLAMEASRLDGGSFSLKGIATDGTYEGSYPTGTFTPEPGAPFEPTFFESPLLGYTLGLTGTTSGGAPIEGFAMTTSKATLLPGESFNPSPFFSAAEATFPPGTLEAFSDLTSLKIVTGVSSPTAFLDSFTAFGAPEVLLLGLQDCPTDFSNCVVPGLGTFRYGFDQHGLNFFQTVGISGLTFHVDDQVAPIPLPAGLPLLLAGLGGLGLIARRKRLARQS